jgi:uncharacterized protein YdhG (YjbR/CyaY superfamily)
VDKERIRNRNPVACEILSYLAAQPSAKDTIEGIAEWWMLRKKIDDAVEEVSRALELLEADGLVLPLSHRAVKKRYYGVNVERLPDIRKLLDEQNGKPSETGSER